MLIVFRRHEVKPESKATAKHKRHKFTFVLITKLLFDYSEELKKRAEKAFGDNAQHLVDNLLHAKLPSLLKWSLSWAYPESDTYDQNIAYPERDLEISGLENDEKRSLPTPDSCFSKR